MERLNSCTRTAFAVCHAMRPVVVVVPFVLAISLGPCADAAKLVGLQPCPNPKPPFSEHKILEEHFVLAKRNNITFFSGNATFLQTCDDCKWAVDFGKVTNGRKKPLFTFKGLDCNNLMIKMVLKSRGMPMESKNCEILLGTYVTPDIDINDFFQDSRLPFRTYGLYEYMTQLYSPKETHSCLLTQVAVEKPKKKKTKVKDNPDATFRRSL